MFENMFKYVYIVIKILKQKKIKKILQKYKQKKKNKMCWRKFFNVLHDCKAIECACAYVFVTISVGLVDVSIYL